MSQHTSSPSAGRPVLPCPSGICVRIGTLALGASLLTGCLGSPIVGSLGSDDHVLHLPDGVELVQTPDGVRGTILGLDGRTVLFEAVRGPASIEEPSHAGGVEVDARYATADGESLFVQVGGHALQRPAWVPASGSNDERSGDLALIGRAAEAIAHAHLPSRQHELDALTALGRTQAPSDVLVRPRLEGAGAATLAVALMSFITEVRKKDAFHEGVPADHSAVRVIAYSATGRLQGIYYTCNHGTCANDSSMRLSCSARSSGAVMPPVLNESCDRWTLYPSHLCNGDTTNQLETMQTGRINTTGCFAPRFRAPTCPASNGSW